MKLPARFNFNKKFAIGPEFPGCYGTGTRLVLQNVWSGPSPVAGIQAWIICEENARQEFASQVRRGVHAGKRIVKVGNRPCHIFKTRASAVATFERLCTELDVEYTGIRDQARRDAEIVRANPRSAEGIAAAMRLSDM